MTQPEQSKYPFAKVFDLPTSIWLFHSIAIIIIVFASARVEAQELEWKATLTVVDEMGKPVPVANATVYAPVMVPKNDEPWKAFTFLNGREYHTDSNGVLTVSGHSATNQLLAFVAEKDGYYPSSSTYELSKNDPTKWTLAATLTLDKSLPFTRLFSFDGTNGANPLAGLTIGKDGNLYGTTLKGGVYGKGTVFKVTLSGKLTTLLSFDGTNGVFPQGELVQDNNDNLYGTTAHAIFKIGSDGMSFTNLFSFPGEMGHPVLALSPDENVYGITSDGGKSGDGLIIRITPDGNVKTLLSLGIATGSLPRPGLILGHDGNLYGSFGFGGKYYSGTFFRLATNGILTTLASFNNTNDFNSASRNRLVQGADGDFYGTTEFGGKYDIVNSDNEDKTGDGTFYKVSTYGAVTTLASFNGWNGSHPRGALVQAKDGSFYGVTAYGGPTLGDCGTIFRATTNGIISTIFQFDVPGFAYHMTNGRAPCGLVEDGKGNLYGTTILGGEKAHLAGPASGTIFRFNLNSEGPSQK